MDKSKKLSRIQVVIVVIFAFLASIALTMQFIQPVSKDIYYTANAISEIFRNINLSLMNTSTESTLLFFCFVSAGLWVERQKNEKVYMLTILSFCLATVWLMGKGYSIDNSLDQLHSSSGQIVKSVIYLLGITWLINQSAYLLYGVIHRGSSIQDEEYSSGVVRFCVKHFFWTVAVGLLLCWLPHAIIAYPGYTCYDSWNQLVQYFGIIPIDSGNPLVHTILMGSVIELGIKLHSGEFGMFLFVVLQMLCFAAVAGYSISTMKALKVPKWLVIGSFFIYAVVPYCSAYVIVLLKDNLYSYAFLLFMVELIWLLVLKDNYFKSPKHIILALVAVFSVSVMRLNGKYILYVMFGVAVIFALYKIFVQKKNRRFVVQILAVLVLPLICSTMLSNYFVDAYDIAPGSPRGAYAVLFQPIARYVSTYGDEITEEERYAIDAVLDYERLPEVYDPRISDPVARTYNEDTTAEDMGNFIKTWFKLFAKRPMVFVNAIMNQNYCLLYPNIENVVVYGHTHHQSFIEQAVQIEGFETSKFHAGTSVQVTDRAFNLMLFSLPFSGVLSSPAVYNLILILVVAAALRKKKFICLIASLPILLSDGVILLSPVILSCPRYAFPVVYTVSILLAFYTYLVRTGEAKEKN